jgi:4,5-dihydroxyphthalate decarboxylase
MTSQRLVMACDAPELALLKPGTISFGDFEIEIRRVHPRERHKQMAQSLAFDICEFSLVDYLHGFERGLPFTAIPTFPHRIFRHRDIWISSNAGVKEPKDLTERRVGIQSWTNSASVWQRGLLSQDYGVDLRSIEWVSESPVTGARSGPLWAHIQEVPAGRTLDQLLASGDIDAMMIPRPPELVAAEMARIGRLFPDYVAVEQNYRARTGVFPIMHVMVLKDELIAGRPGIAKMVSHGVQAAIDTLMEHKRSTESASLVWPGQTWSEQEKCLGPYAWPAGVEANQKELELLIAYGVEQGILTRGILPEELFQGKK